MGVTLAMLRVYRQSWWNALTSKPWILLVVGISSVVGAVLIHETPGLLDYAFTFTLVSIGFGALVASAMSNHFWLAQAKIPGAATISSLAFTLYLTHKQMLHLAKVQVDDYVAHPAITISLAAILILLASLIVHHLIEKPFLKWRDILLARSEDNVTNS